MDEAEYMRQMRVQTCTTSYNFYVVHNICKLSGVYELRYQRKHLYSAALTSVILIIFVDTHNICNSVPASICI